MYAFGLFMIFFICFQLCETTNCVAVDASRTAYTGHTLVMQNKTWSTIKTSQYDFNSKRFQ